MSVESFAPEQAVTVTEAAQAHFRSQLQGRDNGAIRLSVKESGCTGYKYVIDVVDESEEAGESGDVRIDLADGVTLYVSAEAMAMVRGTEIDYAKEGLNRTLKFYNPNVSDECGCGESFSVSSGISSGKGFSVSSGE